MIHNFSYVNILLQNSLIDKKPLKGPLITIYEEILHIPYLGTHTREWLTYADFAILYS
jgi:hypothetical protein